MNTLLLEPHNGVLHITLNRPECRNAMSLSMVSTQDAILDHYGKLLVARLREAAPEIELEVCFPASADALISRFNEVLQTYSIQDAMGNKVQNAPPKIWIVHDAAAIAQAGSPLLGLLQRLPSVFRIRQVSDPIDRASASACLLNDAGDFYFRLIGHRLDGEAGVALPARSQPFEQQLQRVSQARAGR